MNAEEVIARARSAVGSRFRLHGRDPRTGLDCVGLAAFAAGLADPPCGYSLRGGNADAILEVIHGLGLKAHLDDCPGTIQLVRAGPAQFHLIICTASGFIHADAALRRIVERPGPPPWPVIGRWRP